MDNQNDEEKKKKERKRIFAIIGIAAGLAIIIIIIILLLLTFCRNKDIEETVIETEEEIALAVETETESLVIEEDTNGSEEDLEEEPEGVEEEPEGVEEEPEEEPLPDNGEAEEIAEGEPEADEEIIEVAPTISIEIIEGPLYSSADGVCYYRVEATVSGIPSPEIEWSKDDSLAAFGENIAQVNLHDINETYTLIAAAENVAGIATDSIELSWGCNRSPIIDEITLMGNHYTEVEYMVSVSASDPDGDVLSYSWSIDMGTIENPETNPIEWTAPDEPGTVNMTVTVTDGRGGTDSMTESVEVIEMNKSPEAGEIEIYEKGDTTPVKFVFTDQEYELFIEASDPNDDPLIYTWEVSGGTVANKNMNPATWTTPSSMGDYVVKVKISDGRGGSIEKTKTIEAKYYIY